MRLRNAALLLALSAAPAASQTPSASDAALIEKGRYVATAADCDACHTAPGGGKPYAGGYAIESPLGAIIASNITPSRTAGIGAYSEAQFAAALRRGVRADGANLYPAMPYTAYAKITDADMHALYAYFMRGVAPVDSKPADTALPLPFNIRLSMAGWNLLFLDAAPFAPNPAKDSATNRGAYLVQALAHCSACHTPRNLLMAERSDRAFAGAPLGAWYAPNITPDKDSGIGAWTDDELFRYFKTGDVPGRAQAGGGMAEAIQHSLQYLTDDDTRAIIAYLRSLAPIHSDADTRPGFAFGAASAAEPGLRGVARPPSGATDGVADAGSALFSANCASCHQPGGAGTANAAYPALFHNTATGRGNANNLVAAILYGVERTVGDRQVLMPRFDDASPVAPLSDTQIAAISTYVLRSYGNPAITVTAADVALLRGGGPASPLVWLASTNVQIALLAVAAVIGLAVAGLLGRVRRA